MTTKKQPGLVAAKSAIAINEEPKLRLEVAALKIERDFWVEQARNLQNHLQTVMRGQAAMLEQMARGGIQESEVLQSIEQVQQELRQPLTSVEAIAALTASIRPGTQGAYTQLHCDERGRPISSLSDSDRAWNRAQRIKGGKAA